MTELQEIEFEILNEFVQICEQLDLKYYLVCGSCLGAVKYKGFIPWDDDIDVALPREDYTVFCQKAPKLLHEEFFLQNYQSEPFFPLVSSKLRNINTTFVEKNHSQIDMAHGVYIDIFPLDGFPQNEDEIQAFRKKQCVFERKRMANIQYDRFSPAHIKEVRTNLYYLFQKLFNRNLTPSKLLEEYTGFLTSYSTEGSVYWCNHHEEHSPKQYNPAQWYGEGVLAKFEGLNVRVPSEYEKYLSRRYGNWRADLPDEQKTGHHTTAVLDLTRPYKDYVVPLTKGKIRLKNPDIS